MRLVSAIRSMLAQVSAGSKSVTETAGRTPPPDSARMMPEAARSSASLPPPESFAARSAFSSTAGVAGRRRARSCTSWSSSGTSWRLARRRRMTSRWRTGGAFSSTISDMRRSTAASISKILLEVQITGTGFDLEQPVEIELGAAAIDQLPGDILELVEQDAVPGAPASSRWKTARSLRRSVRLISRPAILLLARRVEGHPGSRGGELGKLGLARPRRTEQEDVDAARVLQTGALRSGA